MLEAIVLAGGFGKRLRNLVPDVPKPMAPIAGRPFLKILLSSLAGKNFQRVILSLGFMADVISSHFCKQFAGMKLDYVVEDKPLGTGGAVRLAMECCRQDHVFIFNGDTFLDLETDDVERQWQNNRRPIIVGCEIPDTTRYGRLVADKGRVAGFAEKGVSGPGLINAGCYVFKKGQLDAFVLNSAFSLEIDYLREAVLHTPFDLFLTSGQFIDIGVPEDFLRAQIELARR